MSINNSEIIRKEYYKFKNKAIAYSREGKIEKSLLYFKYVARIATVFPILSNFIDEEVENELRQLTSNICGNNNEKNTSIGNKKSVILYCGQIIDRGALTEQYLHTLVEKGYQVLLIVPDKLNTLRGNETLQYISENSLVQLFIPESKTIKQKILEIRSAIAQFNPSKIFMHFLPYDVEGFCSVLGFNQPKFYIVHNDHTFWLGKTCSDYFIEFRNFGISMSVHRRKIPKEKILHIPFYPIIDTTIQFQGYPFDRKGKVVGISGANLYKYFMDPTLKYFHAIKDLLRAHENFVFCLCGRGDEKRISKFIDENKLHNKFYYLGERNDFSAVVANADILFESYPFKGGLTPLFATYHKKPIIGMVDDTSPLSSVEDFLSLDGYKQPDNFADFKIESNRLIISNDYRNRQAELFADNKNTKANFNKAMSLLLDNDIKMLNSYEVKPFIFNDSIFLNRYLSVHFNANIKNVLNGIKLDIISTNLNLLEKIKISINYLFSLPRFNSKKALNRIKSIAFSK